MDAAQARRLGYQSAGEVAELLGVTLRTVRYYEEEGLVTPARSDKGTRYYSDFAVQRLEVCVRLTALEVPIKTLKELATLRPSSETGEDFSHQLVEVFDRLRSDLRSTMANVRFLLGGLEKAERVLRTCRTCVNPPNLGGCPGCPGEQRIDGASVLNLTADDGRHDAAAESEPSRPRPRRRKPAPARLPAG